MDKESWSKISDLNTQKIEQKEKYENQIVELELKNEELETKVEKLDDKHQMFETVLKHDATMEKLLN
ncbi:16869_t:CDS:2 [Funneliformis geosporum]|uniref:16869_t:CDS:1 n=1 Tax=Funneliformis geosporum TaxID=1117311 RepID=A0A9W4SA97_9GLOM|nr:16869_t:CDS:2 [Funneliformis geosporum]